MRSVSRPSPCGFHTSPTRGAKLAMCPFQFAAGIPGSPGKNSPAGAVGCTVLTWPARKAGRLKEVAAPIFIGVGEGRLPAQAEVQREVLGDSEAVLRVDAHHPLPQIVRRRVGLLEVAHVSQHEIRHPQAGKLAIEGRRAIFVEARDGVVLHADEVEPESRSDAGRVIQSTSSATW